MKFAYIGFTHKTLDVRLYSFEGVDSERIRKAFLVAADVALMAKHRIRIQDAPMICLRLLESSAETDPQLASLVLTEAAMLNHLSAQIAEAEKAAKKKAKWPFRSANAVAAGMAWRSQQPV